MDPALKQMGDHLFALSPLTFTHEMARFLLLEQLYRAVSIVQGGKYHHE
jgi:23S rRNA (pseudouridine1915-N3)-methyltransferase